MSNPDEETMLVLLGMLPKGASWKTALSILGHLSVTKFHDFALGGLVRVRKGSAYEPIPEDAIQKYLEQLRHKDPHTFQTNKDAENRLMIFALVDLVRGRADIVRNKLFETASSASASATKGSSATTAEVQKLRSKPLHNLPGAPGALETASAPFKPPWCMLLLLWLYLAGSAIWLKMILADSLLLSLNRDLLYEREASDPNWQVARNLSISVDLSDCIFKPEVPLFDLITHRSLGDVGALGDGDDYSVESLRFEAAKWKAIAEWEAAHGAAQPRPTETSSAITSSTIASSAIALTPSRPAAGALAATIENVRVSLSTCEFNTSLYCPLSIDTGSQPPLATHQKCTNAMSGKPTTDRNTPCRGTYANVIWKYCMMEANNQSWQVHSRSNGCSQADCYALASKFEMSECPKGVSCIKNDHDDPDKYQVHSSDPSSKFDYPYDSYKPFDWGLFDQRRASGHHATALSPQHRVMSPALPPARHRCRGREDCGGGRCVREDLPEGSARQRDGKPGKGRETDFVTYASADFDTWWQASAIDQHTAMFRAVEVPADKPASHANSSANGTTLSATLEDAHWLEGVLEEYSYDQLRPHNGSTREPGYTVASVSVMACVEPGWAYLLGCVLEGFPYGLAARALWQGHELGSWWTGVAIDGLCGPTCGSMVREHSYFSATLDGDYRNKENMHCTAHDDPESRPPLLSKNTHSRKSSPSSAEGLRYLQGDDPLLHKRRFDNRQPVKPTSLGYLRLDDVESKALKALTLQWPARLFSVMFTMGVFFSLLMYAPALGQTEGRYPTWRKMRKSILTRAVFQEKKAAKHVRVSTRFDRIFGCCAPSEPPTLSQQNITLHNRRADPSLTAPMLSHTARGGEPRQPEGGTVNSTVTQCAVLRDQRDRLDGMSAVSASISAGESANIVMRNTLGKIAANLQLLIYLDRPRDTVTGAATSTTDLWLSDVFVDEGHRLGIYYIYRAMMLIFYVCIPKHKALEIATSWLRRMNLCEGATSTDLFDKVNVFELLDAKHSHRDSKSGLSTERSRSEIVLLEFVAKMAPIHNQFSQKVPFFAKLLTMPIFELERHKTAVGLVHAKNDATSMHEVFMRTMGFAPELSLSKTANESLDMSFLITLLGRCAPLEYDSAEADPDGEANVSSGALPSARLTTFATREDAAHKRSDKLLTLGEVLNFLRSREKGGVRDTYGHVERQTTDSHVERQTTDSLSPSEDSRSTFTEDDFFDPVLWQRLGRLIVGSMDGKVKKKGERSLPQDVVSYVNALTRLPKAGVFESLEWTNISSLFRTSAEQRDLIIAADAKPFAFDHVENVLASPKVTHLAFTSPSAKRIKLAAIYAARGQPTKWQPKTKDDHRRKVQPGVWVIESPDHPMARIPAPVRPPTLGDDADNATEEAKAEHAKAMTEYRVGKAEAYVLSRERVGLMLDDGGTVHWFGKEFDIDPVAFAQAFLSCASFSQLHTSSPANDSNTSSELLHDPHEADQQHSGMPPRGMIDEPAFPEDDEDDDVLQDMQRQPCLCACGPCVIDCECVTPRLVPHNVHLGKAGGLNFGMQQVLLEMYRSRLAPPSETRPMFFGITDARHAGDERFWLHTLPPFFSVDSTDDKLVTFDPKIALVQIAHAYLGIKSEVDHLDMRNDFMFTGMAVIRDQAYGMTSCGTGGIWSIITEENLEGYFYGRTMIEDTASSTEAFLGGRKSIYVAPFGDKPAEQQLMCAVPKVSANYLEALERWDTGAVQCFCAQAITKLRPFPWFFLALIPSVIIWVFFLLPAFWPLSMSLVLDHSWPRLMGILSNPSEDCVWPFKPANNSNESPRIFTIDFEALLSIIVPVVFWLLCLVFMVVMMTCAPKTTNAMLRGCVLLFNHTYPLTSFSSIFWITIPPWICFSGSFPFQFDPVFAIFGALGLRFVEWLLVMRCKRRAQARGANLKELSIYRSQQLNLCTVPVKVRAVLLGLWSGGEDVFGKRDNSWWASFGGLPQAVIWVQLWLCTIMLTMLVSIIVAVVHIILALKMGPPSQLQTVLEACAFGIVLALINVLILCEPTWYVMRGRKLQVSLRHTEVLVLIFIGGIVVLSTAISGGASLGGILSHT